MENFNIISIGIFSQIKLYILCNPIIIPLFQIFQIILKFIWKK